VEEIRTRRGSEEDGKTNKGRDGKKDDVKRMGRGQ
jgi:hypothetical protein